MLVTKQVLPSACFANLNESAFNSVFIRSVFSGSIFKRITYQVFL